MWKTGLKLNIQKTNHGIQSMAYRWGNKGNSKRLYFLGSKITADDDCSHELKRHLFLGRKAMPRQCIKKQRHFTLSTKVRPVKAMVFPVVSLCRCKSWTIKKAECWRTDVFELWCFESPLDCKENKGNQPWIFIGRTDAEAEALILWPLDGKSWLIGRDWFWERMKAGG